MTEKPDNQYDETETIKLTVPAQDEPEKARRAELIVVGLLTVAGSLGIFFCFAYALLGANTQLLSVTVALALFAFAGALIIAAQRMFPRETAVEPRPKLAEHRTKLEQEIADDISAPLANISRRKLLITATGLAVTGLGAGAIAPLFSLGPNVGETNDTTPWRKGTPLIDDKGREIAADTITQHTFVTAFPAGADPRELGSPIVVVRLDPATLKLPAERAGWAPEGLLAYSKICTHAGCAVALYRSPLNEPTSKPPALVCPCHYSTFDVSRGASVEFGPAGRPLPQLPLAIRADRVLVANGGFSGPIGPAWWSVRREGRTRPA